MATCRHVVNTALRKLGRLGAGREPRMADTTEAFSALVSFYAALVDCGAFGKLRSVVAQGDVTAPAGTRVIRNGDEVTLPEYLSRTPFLLPYGALWPAVCNGYDRAATTPRHGSVIQIKDNQSGVVATWLYDGTAQAWIPLDGLQLDDEAPLSRDAEGLAALLAIQISDTFGAEVGAASITQANRWRAANVLRQGFESTTAVGVYV